MTNFAARLRALAAKFKDNGAYDYYPIYAPDLSTLEGAAAELDRLQTVAARLKYLDHPVNNLKPALDNWVARAEKAEAATKEQAEKLKELEAAKEQAATYKKMLHFYEIRLDVALDILDRCIVQWQQNPPAPDGTPRE